MKIPSWKLQRNHKFRWEPGQQNLDHKGQDRNRIHRLPGENGRWRARNHSTKLVVKQEQVEMLESSITKPIPNSYEDEAPLSDWILDMTDPRLNDNRQPQRFAFLSVFKVSQQLLLLSRCQGITFGYFLDCLEQLFLLLNSCGFGNVISRIVIIQVK